MADNQRMFVTGTRGIPGIMGGVETHCEELFPRLVNMGFEVTVFRRLPYATNNDTTFKGVEVVDLPCTKNKFLEAFTHTFKAILEAKRRGGKYIHIHAIGPAMLSPVARLLGMKVVFTHHGHDYDRAKWNAVAKMCLKFGEWIACKYAEHVIVISDPFRMHWQGNTDGQKTCTSSTMVCLNHRPATTTPISANWVSKGVNTCWHSDVLSLKRISTS